LDSFLQIKLLLYISERGMQGSYGYYNLIIEHGHSVLNERNGGKWWRGLRLLLTTEAQYKHFIERFVCRGSLSGVNSSASSRTTLVSRHSFSR